MFVGLTIILLGTFFLLRNLGVIEGDFWGWFWPSVIILLGLSMILKRPVKKHDSEA